jgi:hypothetical protein
MAIILGVDPGLLEIRLDEGEIGYEEAKKRLLTWWQQR